MRTWYDNAALYNDDDAKKARLDAAIAALDWHDIPCEDVPMMPALGIKGAIRHYGIPARRVAWNGRLAPYALYGIEGHYRTGVVRVYLLDRGTDLLPVAADEMRVFGLDLTAAVQYAGHGERGEAQ